jgi:HEPN domain-containing protein
MIEVDEADRVATEGAAGDLVLELDVDVDVIVTTPETHARDRDDVGLIAYRIGREGRVVYARPGTTGRGRPGRRAVSEQRPMQPRSLSLWVRRAENDFTMMERALGVQPVVADAVCFHAHQTAEKYLEAVIVSTGHPPPRTHRLDRLLARSPARLREHAGLRQACLLLLRLYLFSRYAEDREPTIREARRGSEAAGVVRQAARELLGLA